MRITLAACNVIVGTSILFATGALADVVGKEPGTSSNPEKNVPEEIQRSALGESDYPGGTGAGTRGDKLVGMDKEKSEPVTEQQLEKNVEKTHGGGAAVAAEELHAEDGSKSGQNTQQQK
jgi:hypothetical protein